MQDALLYNVVSQYYYTPHKHAHINHNNDTYNELLL